MRDQRIAPRGSGSDLGRGVGRPRPFGSFANPFTTGAAQRMPIADLVSYSFDALQAWAREWGEPRRLEQTPLEFAHELGMAVPELSTEAWRMARLYGQLAYSGRTPGKDCLPLLEEFWFRMTSMRASATASTFAEGAAQGQK